MLVAALSGSPAKAICFIEISQDFPTRGHDRPSAPFSQGPQRPTPGSTSSASAKTASTASPPPPAPCWRPPR